MRNKIYADFNGNNIKNITENTEKNEPTTADNKNTKYRKMLTEIYIYRHMHVLREFLT